MLGIINIPKGISDSIKYLFTNCCHNSSLFAFLLFIWPLYGGLAITADILYGILYVSESMLFNISTFTCDLI